MKKTGVLLLLAAIAVTALVDPGEAAWKKRGWYMKKPGTECVMRKVTVTTTSGKTVTRIVRVCG